MAQTTEKPVQSPTRSELDRKELILQRENHYRGLLGPLHYKRDLEKLKKTCKKFKNSYHADRKIQRCLSKEFLDKELATAWVDHHIGESKEGGTRLCGCAISEKVEPDGAVFGKDWIN